MTSELFDGKYSQEDVRRIMDINRIPTHQVRPSEAYYKKGSRELAPSNYEKRELVHWIIHESNISPVSKNYLKECDEWIMKY